MADFYREHGGCVLSTSINRYMYLTIHPYFDETRTALKYSQNEIVSDINDIRHSIFHCVLNERHISGVEISSRADVPSGTGLGSSSSFTVRLIHTLACYKGKYISKSRLAEEACEVEIQKLGAPIGKQDQYAAAFGGLNFITFHRDDTVSVEPVIAKAGTITQLQESLVMFYTGQTHNANQILTEQKRNIGQADKTRNLIRMCELAKAMKKSLEKTIWAILALSWTKAGGKSGNWQTASQIRNSTRYMRALWKTERPEESSWAPTAGAFSVLLPKRKADAAPRETAAKPFPFRFEHDGSSVVYIGDKYWEDAK